MPNSDAVERRRAIEVVLERRPDVDLNELADIMSELGTPVDEATLVSDLDALGFEVDAAHGDDNDAIRRSDGAGMAGSADAAGPSFKGPADAFDDMPDRDGRFDIRSVNPTVLVAVGVLVVALIVVAVLTLGGGDDGDDDVATDGSTTTAAEDGDPEPTESTEPRLATQGEGLDPALEAEGVVLDDFQREGPGLGEVPGLGAWDVLTGTWELTDGQVKGSGEDEEAGNLAVFDPGSGDVRAQVELPGRTNGSGIAFRVKDADNYFAWVTAPLYGTLGLVEVEDGNRTTLLDSGLATTGDGMPALGINLEGSKVELLFDGAVTATYDELPSAEDRQGLGLTTARGMEVATFDDLRILPG
ncbi:hypothetical protein BH24ACT4_BH24ACT4_16700 [soil metagenome]